MNDRRDVEAPGGQADTSRGDADMTETTRVTRFEFVRLCAFAALIAAVVLTFAGVNAWQHADQAAQFGTAVNTATQAFGGPAYGSVAPDHSDAITRFVLAGVLALIGVLMLRPTEGHDGLAALDDLRDGGMRQARGLRDLPQRRTLGAHLPDGCISASSRLPCHLGVVAHPLCGDVHRSTRA
jgi:hypothetical protein